MTTACFGIGLLVGGMIGMAGGIIITFDRRTEEQERKP